VLITLRTLIGIVRASDTNFAWRYRENLPKKRSSLVTLTTLLS